MKRVGYFWNESSLNHDTGGHVECVARAEQIRPDKISPQVPKIEMKPVIPHDAVRWILRVHEPAHHQFVQKAYQRGLRQLDQGDTLISEGSYEAALMAVNAVLTAADEVMSGEISSAFCAMRPPGHHALPIQSMGFCLFSNPSILARYLQEQHGVERIAIVDWDVHHGNGTQHVFWEDPNVLLASLQQHPLWPNSGMEGERGGGKGEGATLNLTFSPYTPESDYLDRFAREVIPAVERHRPDIVLISAGFDAHRDDLLGDLELTEAGFAQMTRLVRQVADNECSGKIVSVLEGGYDLAALEASVVAHLSALSE